MLWLFYIQSSHAAPHIVAQRLEDAFTKGLAGSGDVSHHATLQALELLADHQQCGDVCLHWVILFPLDILAERVVDCGVDRVSCL